MHMMSKSMKSICFVHPLPFFLYILSKFSLWYLLFPSIPVRGRYLGTPPPELFLSVIFSVCFIRLFVSFSVSNQGFFSNIFLPIFNSLSMNIRFSLQFLTYSPICIVLSAQYYTLFICHSAYFSSKTTPYRVLPYTTQYYRFKLIIANPYT